MLKLFCRMAKLSFCSRQFHSELIKSIDFKTCSYNALHLTINKSLDHLEFESYMDSLLKEHIGSLTTSIWVYMNVQNSALLPYLCSKAQFKIHRGLGNHISLYRWLQPKEDLVVPYSMFFVACGGVFIRNDHVLLISEKKGERKGEYGLPGGRADFGEDIKKCVQRQVLEELGIKSTFRHLLWLRQLSNYTYKGFDTYYACLMHATDEQLNNIKHCNEEVSSTQWIHLKDIRQFMRTRSYGTHQHLANYLSTLYLQKYDFNQEDPHLYHPYDYVSPKDKVQRFFAEHWLAPKIGFPKDTTQQIK